MLKWKDQCQAAHAKLTNRLFLQLNAQIYLQKLQFILLNLVTLQELSFQVKSNQQLSVPALAFLEMYKKK